MLPMVGVFLALAFGGFQVWTYFNRKRTIRLGFDKLECYSLFRRDISDLNIHIEHKRTPISNPLLLFKGSIVNTGQLDIDQSIIFQPLHICAKKEFKWLESKISKKPSDASVNLSMENDTTLLLEWDLLKIGERINIEALIEVISKSDMSEVSHRFYNSMGFKYRISNLRKIDLLAGKPNKESRIKRKIFKYLVFGLFLTVMGILICFSRELPSRLSFMGARPDIIFEISSFDDTTTTELTTTRDNRIELELDGVNTQLTISEFNSMVDLLRIDSFSNRSLIDKIMQRVFGAFSILMGIAVFWLRKEFADTDVKREDLCSE